MKSHYGGDSPIAAFATTPGSSALTLIRCSGSGAIDLAAAVFAGEKIKNAAGNTVIHGWIVSPNDKSKIDEALVSVFRAPKSYTGEDSLDICCHGGPSAGKAVMEVLKTAGFKDALPGEFTFRAFMNGKMDLTRSESVMELVCAKTETGRRHAAARLSGALEKEINAVKKMLVEVLSGAEIYLDYDEDEIEAEADEIAGKLPRQETALTALALLKKLAASWQYERIYQEGASVVIAGRPNAGKSSLFNLLLKEDRSIVTETPGTTRDWIEAWISVEGIPIRLIDTAGLRESADQIEQAGIERTRKLLREADVVLYLIDGERGRGVDSGQWAVDSEERGVGSGQWAVKRELGVEGGDRITEGSGISGRVIGLWNKCDLVPLPAEFLFAGNRAIGVSAKTGEGLAQVCAAIAEAVRGAAQTAADDVQTAALGSARQKRLVDAAAASLEEALSLAAGQEPLDLIAPLLREAVNALGEITGEVSTADILEEMFSNFCVGK